MKIFNSLIELKKYAPDTHDEFIVQYLYHTKIIKTYYWYECWVEKIYWTIKEAAEFIGESEDDVLSAFNKKYVRGRYVHKKNIKLSYMMLAPIKHMIEQTKNVSV